MVGTDDRRHRAGRAVRRVVPHAAHHQPDGQGGRRRAHDVPMVRGRHGRRRAVRQTAAAARATPEVGKIVPSRRRRRNARTERNRSAGGQIGRHGRRPAAAVATVTRTLPPPDRRRHKSSPGIADGASRHIRIVIACDDINGPSRGEGSKFRSIRNRQPKNKIIIGKTKIDFKTLTLLAVQHVIDDDKVKEN